MALIGKSAMNANATNRTHECEVVKYAEAKSRRVKRIRELASWCGRSGVKKGAVAYIGICSRIGTRKKATRTPKRFGMSA